MLLFCVSVPVVDIRRMLVLMLDAFMLMRVGMFAGEAVRVRMCMVHVVMAVFVVMRDVFMHMPVHMVFRDDEYCAQNHERQGDQKLKRRSFF